jgi:hypothetical protein
MVTIKPSQSRRAPALVFYAFGSAFGSAQNVTVYGLRMIESPIGALPIVQHFAVIYCMYGYHLLGLRAPTQFLSR